MNKARKLRSIQLTKETLRDLDPARLRTPRGAGAAGVAAQISQEGDSCLQSCYINTCYETCQWQGLQAAFN